MKSTLLSIIITLLATSISLSLEPVRGAVKYTGGGAVAVEVQLYDFGTSTNVYPGAGNQSLGNLTANSSGIISFVVGKGDANWTAINAASVTNNYMIIVTVGGTVAAYLKLEDLQLEQGVYGSTIDESILEIPDGEILIGNADDDAVSYAISGDASMTNAGVLTVDGLQGRDLHNAAPTDGQVLTWDNGNSRWAPANTSGGAFSTTGTTTSNSPGTLADDDFVFGSAQLDDDADPDHDSRMFFDKSDGAFRAGTATGSQWDEANVGFRSFAGGYNNTASGIYSTTFGYINTASGEFTTALGHYNTATSYSETVIGIFANIVAGTSDSYVSTDRLFTIGNGTALGSRSDALTVLKNANTTIGGSLTINANGTSVAFPTGRGTNGQVLTTNGAGATSWEDAADGTVSTNSTLSGDGSGGSPLQINLGNANTWTDRQTFSPAASVGVIVENTHLALINDDNTARQIRFQEPSGSGTQYISFQAPALGENTNYVLPATDGTNGQVLTTNGSANLSWSTVGGGGGGGATVELRAAHTVVQAIPDENSAPAIVTWSESFDPDNQFDGSTFTAAEAGDYIIFAALGKSNSSTLALGVYVNGTIVSQSSSGSNSTFHSDFTLPFAEFVTLVELNVNDELTIRVGSNNPANSVTTNSHFKIIKL